jgi:hypothetical protein
MLWQTGLIRREKRKTGIREFEDMMIAAIMREGGNEKEKRSNAKGDRGSERKKR